MTLYAIRPDPDTGSLDDAEVVDQLRYGWQFLEQAITVWRLVDKERADEMKKFESSVVNLSHGLIPFERTVAQFRALAAAGVFFTRALPTGYEVRAANDGIEERLDWRPIAFRGAPSVPAAILRACRHLAARYRRRGALPRLMGHGRRGYAVDGGRVVRRAARWPAGRPRLAAERRARWHPAASPLP